MKEIDENTNVRDYKRCPECGSKNFVKGWACEKEHTYKNGKLVKRMFTTVGAYSDFLCSDCGWKRTDVP